MSKVMPFFKSFVVAIIELPISYKTLAAICAERKWLRIPEMQSGISGELLFNPA
jgi:hypothetical protein